MAVLSDGVSVTFASLIAGDESLAERMDDVSASLSEAVNGRLALLSTAVDNTQADITAESQLRVDLSVAHDTTSQQQVQLSSELSATSSELASAKTSLESAITTAVESAETVAAASQTELSTEISSAFGDLIDAMANADNGLADSIDRVSTATGTLSSSASTSISQLQSGETESRNQVCQKASSPNTLSTALVSSTTEITTLKNSE